MIFKKIREIAHLRCSTIIPVRVFVTFSFQVIVVQQPYSFFSYFTILSFLNSLYAYISDVRPLWLFYHF